MGGFLFFLRISKFVLQMRWFLVFYYERWYIWFSLCCRQSKTNLTATGCPPSICSIMACWKPNRCCFNYRIFSGGAHSGTIHSDQRVHFDLREPDRLRREDAEVPFGCFGCREGRPGSRPARIAKNGLCEMGRFCFKGPSCWPPPLHSRIPP